MLALFVLGGQARPMAPMIDAKDPTLIIPGQYIVVLGDGEVAQGAAAGEGMDRSADTLEEDHSAWLTSLLQDIQGEVKHQFNVEGLRGYSGRFSDEAINQIRRRPEVRFVEPDQVVYALDMVEGQSRRRLIERQHVGETQQLSYRALQGQRDKKTRGHHEHRRGGEEGEKKRKTRGYHRIIRQNGAPWGISRVSHGEMPFSLNKYHYPKSAGKGVDVYVVDTGINIAHEDFEGRAQWGATIPEGDIDIDGNGHGTHCAGTIAGKTHGIAKRARVIAVKVLRTDGFGTNSDVIKGVEWTVRAARKAAARGRRSAANMSLGGGRSLTLEYAVNRAVKSGVHFAVAAGNDNEDACDYSPAAAEGPITVGASTNRDMMAFFSNHGPCVDIFAPGMDITSTWIGSRRAVNTISGTSMAAPHVAGVIALHLSEQDLDAKTLKRLIVQHANEGLLEDLPENTENRLLSTRKLLEAMKE